DRRRVVVVIRCPVGPQYPTVTVSSSSTSRSCCGYACALPAAARDAAAGCRAGVAGVPEVRPAGARLRTALVLAVPQERGRLEWLARISDHIPNPRTAPNAVLR